MVFLMSRLRGFRWSSGASLTSISAICHNQDRLAIGGYGHSRRAHGGRLPVEVPVNHGSSEKPEHLHDFGLDTMLNARQRGSAMIGNQEQSTFARIGRLAMRQFQIGISSDLSLARVALRPCAIPCLRVIPHTVAEAGSWEANQ
jgi:hypothetical protein